MGPVTVSAWTFLFATLILLPFLVKERMASTNARRPRSWSRSDWTGFLMIGMFGLVPASAFLAWGTERSTASNAALIYLTVPILTAVLASIILGERMTWIRWLSLAISLAGVLLLSRSDLRQQSLVRSEFLAGNVLVLLACASSSFYNVYSKDLLKRFSGLEILVYGYAMALVLSILLLIWSEPLTWSGYRLLYDGHLDLGAGLERLQLGFSDGAMDVRTPPLGRDPGFGLDLFVALSWAS